MKKAVFLAVAIVFTLTLSLSAQSLVLTAPNSGGTWNQGVTLHITWTASGLGGSNRLELWNGTSKTGIIAQNLGAGSGDHPWKVGDLIGTPTAAPGTSYKIKVINSGGMEDASNANFTIKAGVQLVTSLSTRANPQPSQHQQDSQKADGAEPAAPRLCQHHFIQGKWPIDQLPHQPYRLPPRAAYRPVCQCRQFGNADLVSLQNRYNQSL